MKYNTSQKGFTLIETLVAIFILTLTMGALITLAAQGFFSVRYLRIRYTSNQLLQESLEYVRNTRDTAIQQNISWQQWVTLYQRCEGVVRSPEAASEGCIVDPHRYSDRDSSLSFEQKIRARVYRADQDRDSNKSMTYWETPEKGFWGQQDGAAGYSSSLKPAGAVQWDSKGAIRRKIYFQKINENQVVITGVVLAMQGNTPKIYRQSILLTNWDDRMTPPITVPPVCVGENC